MAMKSAELKANLIAEIVSLETKEDLRRVFEAAKSRWSELDHRAALMVKDKLKVGTLVTWEGRRGRRGSGKVVKVRQTKCEVLADGTGVKWVVPMSMLNVAGKEE